MSDPEQTGAFDPEGPASSTVPTHIGRYRVERILGHGGFGLVFLAHDEQLQRPVAIKVPHPHCLSRMQAEAYLTEARTVANLDHPHIVPVYDAGRTDEFPCFFVSKFIDGRTLAQRIRDDRPTPGHAAELVATIAEAIHYAHKKGLVHRDIKPGNILLDGSDRPFVADFGLALREQDYGQGSRNAGTPAYMSPEQARGEGHRVDGRSDIFSLGVVLYELLSGRPPFRADSHADLIELVTSHEPRPLRQVDEGIPKELERICFKAMSKRASERYMTAKDFADDLRHFLVESPDASTRSTGALGPASAESSRVDVTVPAANTTPVSTADSKPIKIVPKGLRSFDVHDADFFLELLPGPRDRDGLPDSLRFWKTRIEERDADATFAVGLICGPSGCGKSSLVKAGLLPRLSESVIAVYVEATAAESETRLLNGLRKRCPGLADKLNLHETLAALRRGQGVPTGRKVLIVFDQFEQWLHAKKEEQNTELVQALRQCDGGRLQCIVMVRDDFWMAVIRFMRELEVRLLEGQNSAAIDLFDTDHARKVLAAFGRAFGKLPEQSGQLSKEQREFLTQAVAGLANESKVISIRLALFAEMMKGKAWTPASLKEVGGTEGVGVAFLEETFSAATAPPERRYHQRAARGVLKALLPESGSDIKGHMRSHAELLEASGYTRRPTDFDDLLSILDSEIRLITPTDPEGEGQEHASTALPGQKYYQLTHDYLVHSLRDWLNRKQKETRRGRAELLLADRASVWNARPENRQLPSLWQWLSVRWLTERKNWSPSEQAMMRRATHFHAFRGGVLVACLLILALLGWEGNGRLKARTLRDRLLEASTSEAPAIVQEMAPYRRWVDPLLRESYDRATEQNDARKQLHASIALLPVDATQATYLLERLLTSDPQELKVIRDVLADRAGELTDRLWVVLENPQTDRDRRLRAASALAAFAPENERWVRVTNDVAAILMIQKPFAIAAWTDTLKGAGRWLIPPLARFLVDENRSIVERGLIASVYGEIAREVPDAYARLESQLAEPRGPDATAYAKKQASLGVALLIMGHGEKVWPLLKHSSDPTVRSFLIDRLAPGGVDPKVLIARLSAETEVSIRRAILQSLGEYGLDRMSPAERRNTLPQLAELYRNDPDPGIHAAAELLARQWGALAQLRSIDASFTTWKVEGQRRWYLNRQGQTMVVIPKPGEFWMGGDKEGVGEQRHRRVIDRSFAIASKEVTIDQFRQFREEHPYNRWFARTGDCPAINVLWYDAAAYCNWLSEREGLPKEQWCYLPNAEGRYAEGMTTAPDYLKRTGYRLPTEAEWEYACRAGAATEYSFGESVELLGKYGWYDGSSIGTGHPVGSRRPNDLGLFDLHGNVWEWCQDIFRAYPKDPLILDDVKSPPARDMIGHVLRGGSFNNPPTLSRSANRNNFGPATQDDAIGVRPARTVVP